MPLREREKGVDADGRQCGSGAWLEVRGGCSGAGEERGLCRAEPLSLSCVQHVQCPLLVCARLDGLIQRRAIVRALRLRLRRGSGRDGRRAAQRPARSSRRRISRQHEAVGRTACDGQRREGARRSSGSLSGQCSRRGRRRCGSRCQVGWCGQLLSRLFVLLFHHCLLLLLTRVVHDAAVLLLLCYGRCLVAALAGEGEPEAAATGWLFLLLVPNSHAIPSRKRLQR